jgi:hypothetical protein
MIACSLARCSITKEVKHGGSRSFLLLPAQKILQGKSKRDEISDRDGLLAECTKAKGK